MALLSHHMCLDGRIILKWGFKKGYEGADLINLYDNNRDKQWAVVNTVINL
jgi:hypothetical protein